VSVSDIAIRLDGVTKRFRRFRSIVSHTTLKTALVEWVRGLRQSHSRLDDPNRFDVLKDISLTVNRGETIGLIGRNGSGKSTLLRMIAGIYRPDAGKIDVRGRVAALIELGAGFHPDFTGRENIMINGIIMGLTKAEVAERFERIIAFAEIGDFVDAPIRTYSSGMFTRLAFSVAIHVDPDVLLIDEVLGVGDEAFQQKCIAAIRERIEARAATTVIVSHDLEQIAKLCSKVVVIDAPGIHVHDDPRKGVEEFRTILARGHATAPAVSTVAEMSDVRIEVGGRPAAVVEAESEFEVRFTLRFREAMEQPNLGISVQRLDGTVLYGVNTELLGARVNSARAGDARDIRWTLAARLSPGSYRISLALANGATGRIALTSGAIDLAVRGASRALPGAEMIARVTVASRRGVT